MQKKQKDWPLIHSQINFSKFVELSKFDNL